MKKPYISIICPTTRIGGLDTTFTTLQNQNFKDFELILVDSLYYHRKDLVKEKSKEYFFPIQHLTQLETATDLASCINNALVHANGEIIYFLPDYTWLDVNCLQMHADFHKSKDPKDNYAFIGHFHDCKLPSLHKDFYRTYDNNTTFYVGSTDRIFENEERKKFNYYMDDISSGKLNTLMWSLFENPITEKNIPNSFEITVDKPILSEGFISGRSCVLKNESYLLETLVKVNGLNNGLNGSHGWEDWSLIDKLLTLTNIKLYHNPNALAYTLNPRKIIYSRYRRREVYSNEKIWKDSVALSFKNETNFYSIKEARETLHKFKPTTKFKSKISIILPVMRPGGLDVIFNGLQQQTFKDFELIIVDSLYHYRKDIVKEKAKQFTFDYKHIPSMIDNFPIQSYGHAMNTGIVNASGNVILFTSDYRYFMPDTLQKHANFHNSNENNIGYAPPSKFVLPPKLKANLPEYGFNDKHEQYSIDLKDNKLQDYMWSIFDNEDFFNNSQDPSNWEEINKITIGYDPKADMAFGTEVNPTMIYLQSESIKKDIVLKANGLNEDLDGGHSYPDIEFSHRLRNMFDFKWIADNSNTSYRITGGHNIVNKIKLLDEVENKSKEIFEKYNLGSTEIPNKWSLKEINNAIY